MNQRRAFPTRIHSQGNPCATPQDKVTSCAVVYGVMDACPNKHPWSQRPTTTEAKVRQLDTILNHSRAPPPLSPTLRCRTGRAGCSLGLQERARCESRSTRRGDISNASPNHEREVKATTNISVDAARILLVCGGYSRSRLCCSISCSPPQSQHRTRARQTSKNIAAMTISAGKGLVGGCIVLYLGSTSNGERQYKQVSFPLQALLLRYYVSDREVGTPAVVGHFSAYHWCRINGGLRGKVALR